MSRLPAALLLAGAALAPPGPAAALLAASQEAAPAEAAPEETASGEAAGWQQEVAYAIEASLDESRQVLQGAARLDYGNASPDTLRRLYFHLHLNAFRPNSVWARTEQRARYPFQSLAEPEFAYTRLGAVREGDVELSVAYPGAPDSTVVEVTLPRPLAPGDAIALSLAWESRPSTLCRRQCRRGRHYDFAQWYPRIAVYDKGGWQHHPLYPQGEFYGEFATYDVTLDVAEDQVVGATGVPVAGDPGWRPGPGSPRAEPLWQRDAYGEPPPAAAVGLLPAEALPGRKRLRFRAEDVHHFAWSADPGFVYEGGAHGGAASAGAGAMADSGAARRPVAVHVLYRARTTGWGAGVAVQRTVAALAWLEEVLGPYPYPQLTNLHRLEGGGTEFPMLVMNGSAGIGLIVHETAHQYVHGILANNEWRETWLDEGFASFLTDWYFEAAMPSVWSRGRAQAARREAAGIERPIGSLAESFSDFDTYGYLGYSRPALVLHMLRRHLGEEAFRRTLRAYFERHRFRHVRERDFRRVAEEESGEDLGWFFEQWIHTTATLDYALGEIEVGPSADGGWRTTVEVLRRGEAWMPVTLEVGDRRLRLESRERAQRVEVVTESRPAAVTLDPEGSLLQSDLSNDRRELGEPASTAE